MTLLVEMRRSYQCQTLYIQPSLIYQLFYYSNNDSRSNPVTLLEYMSTPWFQHPTKTVYKFSGFLDLIHSEIKNRLRDYQRKLDWEWNTQDAYEEEVFGPKPSTNWKYSINHILWTYSLDTSNETLSLLKELPFSFDNIHPEKVLSGERSTERLILLPEIPKFNFESLVGSQVFG